MVNQRVLRSIGIAVPIITGVVALGMTKGLDIEMATNFYNTGISVGVILGLANFVVAFLVGKNYI